MDVVAAVGRDHFLFEVDPLDVVDRDLALSRAHSGDGVLAKKDHACAGAQLEWREIVVRTHGVVIDQKAPIRDDGVVGFVDLDLIRGE